MMRNFSSLELSFIKLDFAATKLLNKLKIALFLDAKLNFRQSSRKFNVSYSIFFALELSAKNNTDNQWLILFFNIIFLATLEWATNASWSYIPIAFLQFISPSQGFTVNNFYHKSVS